MMRSRPIAERSSFKCRTVFISDLHLGFEGCSATELLSFLEALEAEQLFLVGDVFELTCGSFEVWPEKHHEVVRRILELAAQGTRVVYVPGNHDDTVRQLSGGSFGNVEIHREYLHETADGRRFLVVHGDEFDGVVRASPWLEVVGGRTYAALLTLNGYLNRVGGWVGLRPYSIASSLKQLTKKTMQKVSKFEQSLSRTVLSRGLDGLICGHLHRPEILDIDGVLYCNDGDWVESCSALVEDQEGQLSLLFWRDLCDELPDCGPGSFAPRSAEGSFATRSAEGSFATRPEEGSFATRSEERSFATRPEEERAAAPRDGESSVHRAA